MERGQRINASEVAVIHNGFVISNAILNANCGLCMAWVAHSFYWDTLQVAMDAHAQFCPKRIKPAKAAAWNEAT